MILFGLSGLCYGVSSSCSSSSSSSSTTTTRTMHIREHPYTTREGWREGGRERLACLRLFPDVRPPSLAPSLIPSLPPFLPPSFPPSLPTSIPILCSAATVRVASGRGLSDTANNPCNLRREGEREGGREGGRDITSPFFVGGITSLPPSFLLSLPPSLPALRRHEDHCLPLRLQGPSSILNAPPPPLPPSRPPSRP